MHDSHETITSPDRVPEPGFYYHYKHDPNGPINNYAYHILNAGHHTEDDARPQDKFMCVYRPLYDWALVYKLGKMFDLRPLEMLFETVEVNGVTKPRFQKIEDRNVIEQLKVYRDQMYPKTEYD